MGEINVTGRFLIAMVVMLLLAAGGASAQELPLAPDPELCTLEPKRIEEIEALVEAASGQTGTPAPTEVPDPFVMPEGFSLLEDERIEIEKDLIRAIACVNTGDPLKVFATYTDRYVVELVERLGGLSDEVIAGLLTVRAIDEQAWLEILSIDDLILLNDGRALVIVTGENPVDDQPAGPRAFYLEEVQSGRWLVDDVVEVNLEE